MKAISSRVENRSLMHAFIDVAGRNFRTCHVDETSHHEGRFETRCLDPIAVEGFDLANWKSTATRFCTYLRGKALRPDCALVDAIHGKPALRG